MSTPLTILLVTRPLVPPWDEASKNFAYFLAKSISDPNIEFHLLTTRERLDGVGANYIQHPIFRSGQFDFEAKARLAAFLGTKARSFDIVHFLFTPTPLNAFLAKHLVGTRPKTMQTIATLREERWGAREWKQMFFADRLVTYTDHSKQKLEATGFKNVERIYPGIDLEKFSPRPKDPETLRALNLSPDDFVVSYAGEYARLGATDMIADMLIRHLSPLPSSPLQGEVPRTRDGGVPHPHQDSTSSSPSPHYSPLPSPSPLSSSEYTEKHLSSGRGDGIEKTIFLFALRVKNEEDRKKKEEIIERFRVAGILDRVRFSDTVSDVAALYNVADIVTFPVADMAGKFDVPLVILEAYACGRPVILSDLPLFREFSNPNISATIPRGDGDSLWNAIESLHRDETKRNTLGANARVFVEQNFDLKRTAEMYRSYF